MALTDGGTIENISQFGSLPSQDDKTVKLFGLDYGLFDLVGGAAGMAALAKPIPWMFYEPNWNQSPGEDYLHLDSPGLKVPFGSTYDIQGFLGFGVDLGVYAHYSYDFGSLTADVTVSAPRVEGEIVKTTLALGTGDVTVNANVFSVAATQPFEFALKIGSSTGPDSQTGDADVGLANIGGGLLNFGVWKNNNPYATVNLGVYKDFDATLIDETLSADAPRTFDAQYLKGFVGAPQLPGTSVTAGGTGLSAYQNSGAQTATGPEFAKLTFSPIELIPVVGDLNSGSIDFIKSPVVDAGVDYRIFGLDIGLGAALRQTLTVSVAAVSVSAIVEESLQEDIDDGLLVDRTALDTDGNGYVTVASASGVLGDTLYLSGFTQGSREDSRVVETYSVTLRIDSSIDLALIGSLNLSFLELSAYINPVLIDEVRKSIGPVFSRNFDLGLSSIHILDGGLFVTFDNVATLTHGITTITQFVGSDADSIVDMNDVPDQSDLAALGGIDRVAGNAKDNVIDGGSGNDQLVGGAGKDHLLGGSGWDRLLGGEGNDRIETGLRGIGTTLREEAFGGLGNDTVISGSQAAILRGDDGDDTIQATLSKLGGQYIYGNDGFDELILDASALTTAFTIDFATTGLIKVITAGTIYPNPPNGFEVSKDSYISGFESVQFFSGSGADVLKGTAGDDRLYSGAGADRIFGRDGTDDIDGGDGNDILYGEGGYDAIAGGSGDDQIYGGSGIDTLQGRDGDDYIDGGADVDVLYGQGGNDILRGGPDAAANDLLGGDGDDKLYGGAGLDQLRGDAGNDLLFGGTGATAANGGFGNDVLIAGTGGGTFVGGGGDDRFQASATGARVAIDGDDPAELFGAVGLDTLVLTNFTTATGAPPIAYVAPYGSVSGVTVMTAAGSLANGSTWKNIEAFDLTGTAGAEKIATRGGNDVLRGLTGNDFLDGGAGEDVLDGGGGDDTLVGSAGDTFLGGAGNDTLIFSATGLVQGFTLNIGTIAQPREGSPTGISQGVAPGGKPLSGIEKLVMVSAGFGADAITGGALGDVLRGGGGNDRLDGERGDDMLYAGNGADTVYGGDGADLIDARDYGAMVPNRGFIPFDRVSGDAGNDTILASYSGKLIEGGGGNDTITIFNVGTVPLALVATIDGGTGADTITGSDRGEIFIGGIDPVDDRPTVITDPGADPRYPDLDINLGYGRLAIDGNDEIHAGGGDDQVRGGGGNDVLFGDAGDDIIRGGSGIDTVEGGAGRDILYGGSGDDYLSAGTTDDDNGEYLDGGSGVDILLGGDQADTLYGGAGSDNLIGGGSGGGTGGGDFDLLDAGTGDDLLSATGLARMLGGDGSDDYTLGEGDQVVREERSANAGFDRVYGYDPQYDVIEFYGAGLTYQNMLLTDTADGLRITFGGITGAPDVLLVGIDSFQLGSPSIVVTSPAVALDDLIAVSSDTAALVPTAVLQGNDSGTDATITNVSGAVGVTAGLAGNAVGINTAAADGAFEYTLNNSFGTDTARVAVNVIEVSEGADTIVLVDDPALRRATGSYVALKGGDDMASGLLRADRLFGEGGNDWLQGNAGDDVLSGGADDDMLYGGLGDDILDGGDGADTLSDTDGFNRFAGGTGNDVYIILSSAVAVIEEARGGGTDEVRATGNVTVLAENVENVRLLGTGNTAATGNALNNAMTGNGGANSLSGGDGRDGIRALDGDDILDGGSGDDALNGGSGSDTLTGGSGADRFIFDVLEFRPRDTVTDFSVRDGDRIDLSAIDAQPSVADDQAFAFIGTAAFSGAAGEVRLVALGAGNWLVELNIDADVGADMTIQLTSDFTPGASDFLL